MIRNLTEIAAIVAVGGALAVGCTDEPTCPEGDTECPTDGCPTDGCPTDGCPTDGCPTDGCPTDGCPTGGCPTATSGFDVDYATSTDFFTRMTTGSAPGTTVHGDFRIYYSTDLQTLIEAGGPFTAPVGATAIKEQFDDNGDLTQFAIMTKQDAGYDADNGDWHYETLSPAGMVTSEGALSGCISCHVNSSDTDYLGGTTFTN